MNSLEKLSLSPEERLLLLCARLDLSQAQRNELDSLVGTPLRWEKVLYLAQWHGLTGLVFRHLGELEKWHLAPPEVRDQLKAAYLANGARNFQARAELIKVLAALESKGVPVVLLKGAALLEEVYQDLRWRPMADLDLLVPDDKAQLAQDVVQGLGYHQVGTAEEQEDTVQRHRHLPGLAHDGKPVLVEVHRHVVRRDSGLYFDIQGFWERARPIEVAGKPASILSPRDQIIHLCLNFFLDRGFRSQAALRQLCDIAETIRRYNSSLLWEQLTRQVKEYDLAGPVSCVLYAAQSLLAAPVPAEVVQRLWPQGFEEVSMRRYLRRRVLDTRPWLARSLARPGSGYHPITVAVAALGRLAPNRRYIAQQQRRAGPGMGPGQLHLTRVRDGIGILFRAAMRPGQLREDLSIDRWIHSLLPTCRKLY